VSRQIRQHKQEYGDDTDMEGPDNLTDTKFTQGHGQVWQPPVQHHGLYTAKYLRKYLTSDIS
jgi:hypothetical protein